MIVSVMFAGMVCTFLLSFFKPGSVCKGTKMRRKFDV